MYNKMFLNFSFVLISFILSSCRYNIYYFNNRQTVIKWEKHQESLLKIKNYQIKGVVTYSLSSKLCYTRVSFIFQKINDKHHKLVFLNPIGWKSFEINILENEKYHLNGNMKNCFSVDYLEKIVKAFLNLEISFNSFKLWIIGLPGNNCYYTYNIQGCLEKINFYHKNDSLIILYLSYYDDKIPILPKLIKVSYNDIYYFDIKIYKWSIL